MDGGSLRDHCAPPLNADFFTQLQRITAPKHADLIRDVIADVLKVFGADFDLTLEGYFTHLESFAAQAARAKKENDAFNAELISERRDRLMAALSAVLEESTDVSRRDSRVCEHHAALITALKPGDTIISFNYDCVIDHALRESPSGTFNAKYGYSFLKPTRILGHENWSSDDPPAQGESLHLLKLHGSINWQLPDGDTAQEPKPIKLKQKLYSQRGTPRFTIIPPENVKGIDDDRNIRQLWTHAERAIRSAETVAMVGFSFTPTDLHVDSLFRFALASSSLKRLVIANPSADHRRKIRAIFAQQLQQGAVVRQYDTLADFADALPAALR